MSSEGNEDIAHWLQDLSAEVLENVVETSPYLELLLELLQAIVDSNSDPQVVYPILSQNIDKLNDQFAQAMDSWARANLLNVEQETAQAIAAAIGNLSNSIQQFPLGNRADNLEIAIGGYYIGLTVFERSTYPLLWANLQNNLGAVFSDRIKGERAENLEHAIFGYQSALEVHTRHTFPEDWAATQMNLGTVYSSRIRGEKAENLEYAIACYKRVLTVYTRTAFPENWASVQNNLASAYSGRIMGEKAENLENAIASYYAALEIYTRTAFPENWASVQNNLASAYSGRIMGEKAENLEYAIACYETALEIYTRTAFPQNWASVLNNLGSVYSNRIKGDRADNLENAIACYQAALQVYTREYFFQDWASVQNNLGSAYSGRIMGERTENLEHAIACYEAALEIYTREYFCQNWASVQNNLASAYSGRIKGDRADNLEQAIAHYEAALEIYTRNAFPENWASVLNNLASAYSGRIKGDRADNLEQAIAHYEAALEIYTRNAFPENWASVQNNLASAYSGRIKGDRANNLEHAIACYQAALEVYTRNFFPQNHAATLFNLGVAYQNVYSFQNAYNTFAQAIDTVESLRSEISSGYESRIKINEEWSKLYTKIVEVCLELRNYTSAIEYADRSKARNLVELIATRDAYPKVEMPRFSQIKRVLDQETAIIEWYILENEFVTFIITAQTQSPIVWRSSKEDLNNLLEFSQKYFSAYREKDWQDKLENSLHELSQILHLDEILNQMLTCQRLCLIPHRYLHNFPLHALPVSTRYLESQSLLELFPKGIQYAPNWPLLRDTANRVRPNFTNLFAIQNPSEDLVFTDMEVENIQQYFSNSTVLRGRNATKEAVINSKQLSFADCLHISGHSFFNFQSPWDSAIILADAEESSDESQVNLRNSYPRFNLTKVLTIAEIFKLNLSQCRLVTLSACETALVDISSYIDEYVSFQSAFLLAGAKTVIGSLWVPSDCSTAILMIKFYQNLSQGLTISSALVQAQIWLKNITVVELQEWTEKLDITGRHRMNSYQWMRELKEIIGDNKCPFANPYHWAAFTVTGALE
ncbi:CHAT domain-containing protein [Planktothrix sp. FACHB-1365]|nr:CHAT domain-containing protein [Planktothrix sp. FACHB-1365]